MSELLSSKSEIPICADFADNTWDEDFMAEISPPRKELCERDDKEGDLDGFEEIERSTTIEELET